MGGRVALRARVVVMERSRSPRRARERESRVRELCVRDEREPASAQPVAQAVPEGHAVEHDAADAVTLARRFSESGVVTRHVCSARQIHTRVAASPLRIRYTHIRVHRFSQHLFVSAALRRL